MLTTAGEHLSSAPPSSPIIDPSPDERGASAVVGRDDELAAVARFLGGATAGAGALVLSGEAGIGKSTVWSAGLDVARGQGMRVLASRPAESEASLAFSALGDVFASCAAAELADLPDPQARALQVALQLVDAGESADRLAVHRAVLTLLRSLSHRDPLVLAIDDVQWLDAPSVAALSYALRRLREAPFRVLVSRRTPHPDPLDLDAAIPDRVTHVAVGPLDEQRLHEIVSRRLHVTVPPATMRAVHARSAGNPFFAVEIVRALPVHDGRVSAERIDIPKSLLDVVGERLRALPAPSLPILAAAGALGEPTVPVLRDFASDAAGLLRPVEDAGVVSLDGDRVRFEHPLLASGALALLAPSERRSLHQRLAQIAPTALERARHRALGAEGASAVDAAQLEAAAVEAAARGATHSAGELAEHAARLTPPDDRGDAQRRWTFAATHFVTAGEIARARAILERLERELPGGPERADVRLLLADTDNDWDASRLRCEQAREDAAGDDARSAEAYRLSSEFTMIHGDVPGALTLARKATGFAERAGDPVLLVRCIGTQAHYETYQGSITPGLLERGVALEDATPDAGGHYSPTQIMGLRLMYADRLDEGRELLERILRRTEERGDDLERTNLLLHLSQLELRAGNWARAAKYSRSLQVLDSQLGIQSETRLFLRALVAAHLGQEREARESAGRALAAGDHRLPALWLLMSRWAQGLLELSLGNVAGAAAALGDLPELLIGSGYRNPGVRPLLPDAIEALVGVGRLDEAERWTVELEERGGELGNPWARATAARCRGLVAAARGDVASARAHVIRALDEHERSPNIFERGRTLLVLGIVERRGKHWKPAREALSESLEIFDGLGAALWSERAAQELSRIQGRRHEHGLTETEQRVAELVASGMTNREAAAALSVSVRAIEANLSRIYSKLGIRSRSELAARSGRAADREA